MDTSHFLLEKIDLQQLHQGYTVIKWLHLSLSWSPCA